MKCQKVPLVHLKQHAELLVSEKKGRHELGSGFANFGCL